MAATWTTCFRTARYLAYLLLATHCLAAYAAGGSLLINGDFSAGRSGWWGDAANVVKQSAAGDALELAGGFVAQDRIAVQGGLRYRIQMRLRTVDAPAGSTFVQVSFRGPNVDAGWRGIERMAQPWGHEAAVIVDREASGSWTSYDVVVQAPPQANQILLYLRKAKGTAGVAQFARVTLTATDEPVTTVAAIQAAQTRASLFRAPLPDAAREAALAAVIRSGEAAATQLQLAVDGVTRYHIHVGANADAMTLHAASELADYLKQITGADFSTISDDNAPQGGPLIVIGRSNRLAEPLCPLADFDALGDDGFVLCTSGRNLVIAGNTSRGTMYGVNWFLDRTLGVKWLAPDATYVPTLTTLRVAAPHERQIPRFAYREVLSSEGQNKAFRAHNLLDGESHGPSFSASPAGIDDWDHSWLAKGGDASFWDLLPRERYAKEHPEWYAGGQVAMMNPAVRKVLAANIVARMQRLPDYTKVWFGLHDMDWGWDMDAASKAFADLHGGNPSAPLLDMVMDVAAQVREVLPGARFTFDAYHWGFAPPTGMSVPDYILVYPMTIQVDYSTPLDSGRNVELGKDLASWNAISQHMFVWDHVTNFGGSIQPTPNIYPIGASIQWLATLKHVTGYFAEGSWFTPGAEFASLRVWLIARLLWDPSQDVHALVAQYCRDYFGAAGPYVLDYIDLMHRAIATSGDVLAEETPVAMGMYTRDFVVRADQLLAEGERAVSGDPVLMERVRQARMPLDFVILVRRNEYESASAGDTWQLDYPKRLARFKEAVRSSHLVRFRQGGNLQQLDQLLSVERRVAVRPVLAVGLTDSDWRDFQDLSLDLYDSAHIVADATASDGAASCMRGNSSIWAVQFKFDNLPREGLWDLYVSMRVNTGPGANNQGGVRVGSYPPMALFSYVPGSVIEGSDYREIRVPGGPFAYGTDHDRGVYAQAANLGSTDQVCVDRVFAIRHR